MCCLHVSDCKAPPQLHGSLGVKTIMYRRYNEKIEIRIKEAFNPFNLVWGIKSKVAITISVTGKSQAITPATDFNKGEERKTALNV